MKRGSGAFYNISILSIMALTGLLPLQTSQASTLPDPILLVTNSAYASNVYGPFLGEILRAVEHEVGPLG